MRHETVEPGKLITFEGGEGAGKSTQVSILVNRLLSAGRHVIATREPGGSPAAEQIREALLSGKVRPFGPFAEALLFSVARQDHVDSVIAEALAQGKWVVCDRFLNSTRAYQGVTGGVPAPVIGALERLTLRRDSCRTLPLCSISRPKRGSRAWRKGLGRPRRTALKV